MITKDTIMEGELSGFLNIKIKIFSGDPDPGETQNQDKQCVVHVRETVIKLLLTYRDIQLYPPLHLFLKDRPLDFQQTLCCYLILA